MYRRCFYTLTRSFIHSLQIQETTQARSIQIAFLDCLHKRKPTLITPSYLRSFHTSSSLCKRQKEKGPRAAEEEEVSEHVDLPKYKEKLEKIIDLMKQEYTEQLPLRTNIACFERLKVETDNGVFPLNQLGSVVQKNPSLVVINMSQSIQYVRNAMKALQNSGMNLNPQQDGPSTIYIHIAKLSYEHRELLAKNAKALFNKTKVRLEDMYSKFTRPLRKDKSLPVSTRLSLEKALSILKDNAMKRAEQMMKNKQKELLGK